MPLPIVSALRRPREVRGDGPPFVFRHVFDEYGRYVWRVLRRMGVPEADVPDLAQEVFIILRQKLDQVRSAESLRPYIYGIAMREASEHRRSARVRRETLAQPPPEGSIEAPQEEAMQKLRAHALLQTAVAELDDDKRAVFVLYELEELNMNEIAEAVNCPLQTAYSRLHAARRIVNEVFQRAERSTR